jgi:hypothetical protein
MASEAEGAEEEEQQQTEAIERQDFNEVPVAPSDLAAMIRSEQLKTVLEASRFPEVAWACNVISKRPREPLSQKQNMMFFKAFVSSQGVATSFYSSEEDRRFIMGEVSLLRALFHLNGYKDDINAQRNFELYLGDFAAEVQTRKGVKGFGARLLTMAIHRVEEGTAEPKKPQGGWLSRMVGGGR